MGWNDVTKNGSSTEKTPYTKFENGSTIIRILDNEPFSFWSHWLPQQKTSITCPGKDCPICNVIRAQKANKETPQYSSSQRHCVRVWNYKEERLEIMIQGRTFFSQLLDLHKEVGDITTYDIKVIRKGEGTNTTYTLLPQAVKEFEVPDKEAFENINLEHIMRPPTHEEILQLMEGKTWAEINGAVDEPTDDSCPF